MKSFHSDIDAYFDGADHIGYLVRLCLPASGFAAEFQCQSPVLSVGIVPAANGAIADLSHNGAHYYSGKGINASTGEVSACSGNSKAIRGYQEYGTYFKQE